MSTQYNGIPSDLSATIPAASLAIASSTNASPIVVTTTGNHGLSTGDDVLIEGHRVNTGAIGRWTVTVVNLTQFKLNGSVGVGVGGATGGVFPLTDGPTYQIPADGDDFDAAAFNVAYEALGDRTAFNLGYVYQSIEWGSVKRAPLKIADRASATTYHANPSIASIYQFATQTTGFTVTLDRTSFPPLDGQTMTFIFDTMAVTINLFNEGGADGATVGSTAFWIVFRYSGASGFWKVIGAATIDGAKMIFSNPF